MTFASCHSYDDNHLPEFIDTDREKQQKLSASAPNSLEETPLGLIWVTWQVSRNLWTCSRARLRVGATVAHVSQSPLSQVALGGSIPKESGLDGHPQTLTVSSP